MSEGVGGQGSGRGMQMPATAHDWILITAASSPQRYVFITTPLGVQLLPDTRLWTRTGRLICSWLVDILPSQHDTDRVVGFGD